MRWLWWRVALILVVASVAARADILEWRDAQGDRHFTNNIVNVPEDRQATARILVVAAPAEVAVAEPPPVAQPEPVREPILVYDQTEQLDDYVDGLRAGLALAAAASAPVGGGGVNITGPLAVTSADTGATALASPFPLYYPLVTTSFDRGRSRGLTLRLLLQDQFQIDRDGPFIYERLIPIGLGPNLPPFLPRGLPRHCPQCTGLQRIQPITH